MQDPHIKVLMVCLGNICRSPTAHGVFASLITRSGLQRVIHVDSAGTGDWHIGEKPDARAREAASHRGYDLENLRARQIELCDYENFDYILAMDEQNLANMKSQCPEQYQQKLQLLLDYLPSSSSATVSAVPDPYYSGPDGFQLVLDLVESAAEKLLEHIRHTHPALLPD